MLTIKSKEKALTIDWKWDYETAKATKIEITKNDEIDTQDAQDT